MPTIAIDKPTIGTKTEVFSEKAVADDFAGKLMKIVCRDGATNSLPEETSGDALLNRLARKTHPQSYECSPVDELKNDNSGVQNIVELVSIEKPEYDKLIREASLYRAWKNNIPSTSYLESSGDSNSVKQSNITKEDVQTRESFVKGLDLKLDMPEPQLQPLRDEVRAMVAAEKPLNGIPLYRGRPIDGDSGVFLRKHYRRYLLGAGSDVLFASDLSAIDGRLLRAIRFDFPGKNFPIGNKSDLINALAIGKFTDGANTNKRIKDAIRLRKKLGILPASK